MVKNEMDIIESFVRYNANIFDGMIILDNGSTDNTLKILKLLKSDGLPLFIIVDQDKEYDQVTKMNQLLYKAVKDHEADIIVPLDADEFLISSTRGNPRKILEKIEDSIFYKVKWRTYIPDFNRNEKFIPAKINFSRDESLEKFYKVIIPKELVKKYEVRLTTGNHDLVYDKKYENLIKPVINDKLRIAHFPIRSKEQTASKIMVGWIYILCRPERRESDGFHWQKIFNKLKEDENIENEDIINFAKLFALIDEDMEIKLDDKPIDLTFCKNIQIKYTNNKINPIANLLEACEWLSLTYLNLKKEKLEGDQKLKILMKEENLLKSKIEEYENSTSWIITSPLRKLVHLIKNLRN